MRGVLILYKTARENSMQMQVTLLAKFQNEIEKLFPTAKTVWCWASKLEETVEAEAAAILKKSG